MGSIFENDPPYRLDLPRSSPERLLDLLASLLRPFGLTLREDNVGLSDLLLFRFLSLL